MERIAGVKGLHPLDAGNIPGCTYCSPQVASVGMTEAKAKAAGYAVKTGKFNLIGNGKAIAMGEPEGFIKTVFDAKTGALLGAYQSSRSGGINSGVCHRPHAGNDGAGADAHRLPASDDFLIHARGGARRLRQGYPYVSVFCGLA